MTNPTESNEVERTFRNGFLSVPQILQGDAHRPPILPISRTSFYGLIKSGVIPQPTKIGACNYFHASVVDDFIQKIRDGAAA